jgi:hypothetical protein
MSVTEDDLKAVGLADDAAEFICPDCGKPFTSASRLAGHRNFAHRAKRAGTGRERKVPGKVASSSTDTAIQKVVDKTVENLKTVGGFVSILLPRTGTAIAGVKGQVVSRAELAGGLLFEQAKSNARVLEMLQRFNGLFEGGTAGKVVADLAAAVASDIGVIDPHFAVEVGPLGEVRPIEMLIGDVLAYVEPLLPQPEEQAPSPIHSQNGEADVTVVQGGVENT